MKEMVDFSFHLAWQDYLLFSSIGYIFNFVILNKKNIKRFFILYIWFFISVLFWFNFAFTFFLF